MAWPNAERTLRQRTTCPHGEAWRPRLSGLMRGGACTALLLFLGCGSVQAQETDVTVGLSTGPVLRGIALGPEGISAQMAASYYSAARWFVTFGATTLRQPSNAPRTLQLTERVGYTWTLSSDWGAQLDYSHYTYPLDSSLRPFRYDEVGTTFAYRDLAFMSISVLRRTNAGYDDGSRWSFAYDLVGRQPLRPGLAMTAGVGYEDRHRQSGFGYAYGHVGLGARVDAAQLEVSYILTDNTAKARFGARASNRWAASLRWSF